MSNEVFDDFGPRRFPLGDVAFQERYLVAFRGITEMVSGGNWDGLEDRWVEMFNVLIGEKELDGEASE